ncbi:hypothetical protein LXL04_004213 [Taraxacum kok-saghyz]
MSFALIGLALDNFIDGSNKAPPKTISKENVISPNPAYTMWYRQDQVILSAILGSCSDAIQPLLTSAPSVKEACDRLGTSYASQSRSRIISLKSKLAKNPKGNRSIADFLNDMRMIADELAIAQSPIDEEDLMVHILSQLGDEYGPITAALKIRETSVSFSELFDKLVDFEHSLKETDPTPLIATANYTQQQPGRTNNQPPFDSQNRSQNAGNRSNTYCHFCQIPGHEIRDCRKLVRFLKDHNITGTHHSHTLVANVTSSSSNTTPQNAPWLFDTGASHHITSDRSSLHRLSEYSGLDEIILGDGTTLPISHNGHTNLPIPHRPLNLSDVLCVPTLRQKLISVAKLCRTNQVSVDFFPLYFTVKDLCTGALLMRGENRNDVYYATPFSSP